MRTPPTLRSAAQALLASWDDPDGNRPALPGSAVEALRVFLATTSATRTRTASITSRQLRPDTKRAAVFALLRRPEGATVVVQVAEITGWGTHAVRGFFANLSKAGTPPAVLEYSAARR